jgi:UDP-N-acetylmuramoylalanine--D-glutamate ligase
MIVVQGFAGRRVGVLGLGRSGLATAAALAAGGAEVCAWDDSAEARAQAEAAGIQPVDLSRQGAVEGLSTLIVSPGIPHLYPAPHPLIAAACAAGIPIDNDIGLFFRSLGRDDWAAMDAPPRVIAVTGSNGKSTTTALITHVLRRGGRPVQMAGNIGTGFCRSSRRARGRWWCWNCPATRPNLPAR